jgi:hypothetical protein
MLGIATVGGAGAAGGSGVGAVGATTAGSVGSVGATTDGRAGRVGATGGAGGEIVGATSSVAFPTSFEIAFRAAAQSVLLFQVQIQPWIVVATVPKGLLSVVPPHVQFQFQIHVVGNAEAPEPAVGVTIGAAEGAASGLGT